MIKITNHAEIFDPCVSVQDLEHTIAEVVSLFRVNDRLQLFRGGTCFENCSTDLCSRIQDLPAEISREGIVDDDETEVFYNEEIHNLSLAMPDYQYFLKRSKPRSNSLGSTLRKKLSLNNLNLSSRYDVQEKMTPKNRASTKQPRLKSYILKDEEELPPSGGAPTSHSQQKVKRNRSVDDDNSACPSGDPAFNLKNHMPTEVISNLLAPMKHANIRPNFKYPFTYGQYVLRFNVFGRSDAKEYLKRVTRRFWVLKGDSNNSSGGNVLLITLNPTFRAGNYFLVPCWATTAFTFTTISLRKVSDIPTYQASLVLLDRRPWTIGQDILLSVPRHYTIQKQIVNLCGASDLQDRQYFNDHNINLVRAFPWCPKTSD